MTFEIKLSQLENRAQFEAAVAEHIARMTSFNKELNKPRPVAHPMIEAAIKRVVKRGAADEYVPDYSITDDTPTPTPAISLDDRKRMLFARLLVAEQQAKDKILPNLKGRLASIKASMASQKTEEDRSAEEKEDLASWIRVCAAWATIDLQAAHAQSDLDDLTEETIDSWQVPDLG